MSLLQKLNFTEQSIVSYFKDCNLRNDHNVIFTTIDDDTFVVVNEDNILHSIRLLPFDKITFFNSFNNGLIKENIIYKVLDIDTQNYFISSSFSLLDILKKRACELKLEDLSFALIKEDSDLHDSSITLMNNWLFTKGLLDYRFILLSDIDKCYKSYNKKNTVIDTIYNDNKKYIVWVKNVVEYCSPEYLLWLHDLKGAANDDWLRYDTYIHELSVHNVYTFEFITILDKDAKHLKVGTIIVYPNKIITNNTSNDIISDFLTYIEELIYYHNSSIILAGYFLEFFENTILSEFISLSSEWAIINNCLVHLKSGHEAILFDASLFFQPSNKSNYVKYWTKKTLCYKNYFKDRNQLSKYIVKKDSEIIDRVCYLHAAVNNHITYLMDTFKISGFDFKFSGLLDVLLFGIFSRDNKDIFYPKRKSVINILTESIYADFYFISDINKLSKKIEYKNIFPIIIENYYPKGKPYFTHTPNEDRLSICLCEVTVCKDIKNPLLYSKKDINSRRFIGIFTSVDISTAVELRGYKIKIIGCLEWPEKFKILLSDSTYLESLLRERRTDLLHSYILKCNITEDIAIRYGIRNNLTIISFIVSYCRSYTYKLLNSHTYESCDIAKCKYNQAIYN
ncbi:SWPV1-125 [Shearwaterpox virus]|uniref:SWPV1-125 n=1 Tax=Shearwaterpox virus TaxID=1974596 RepID=A0A1V0S825_CNPV|nr:SWPV1-125 [Shearwaterpox virus]